MQENADQKDSEYRHFSRSALFVGIKLAPLCREELSFISGEVQFWNELSENALGRS